MNTEIPLFSPDRFIISGGVGKNHEQFAPLRLSRAAIVTAQRLNEAGMVGTARAARESARAPAAKRHAVAKLERRNALAAAALVRD